MHRYGHRMSDHMISFESFPIHLHLEEAAKDGHWHKATIAITKSSERREDGGSKDRGCDYNCGAGD